MGKEVKKEEEILKVFLFLLLIMVLIIPIISADVFGWMKKTITGRDTAPVSVNISIGRPEIRQVYNSSITTANGLSQGPLYTSLEINFSAYLSAGIANLNWSTATINATNATGTGIRQNSSCYKFENDSAGNNANFTCNVTMWWWDNTGTWGIVAYIRDNSSNIGTNSSNTTFSVGSTTAIDASPAALAWPGVSPGATNQTSSNDPMLINNTGNQRIGFTLGNISINATNLRGETNNALALWAGNFSVGLTETPVAVECNTAGGTANAMNRSQYVNISSAILPEGNYTVNDNTTAQEQLFFCLKVIGSELTNQFYSTANESTWTLKVGN